MKLALWGSVVLAFAFIVKNNYTINSITKVANLT